jgi:hypothetical protein
MPAVDVSICTRSKINGRSIRTGSAMSLVFGPTDKVTG